jgi:hypothetical protein
MTVGASVWTVVPAKFGKLEIAIVLAAMKYHKEEPISQRVYNGLGKYQPFSQQKSKNC